VKLWRILRAIGFAQPVCRVKWIEVKCIPSPPPTVMSSKFPMPLRFLTALGTQMPVVPQPAADDERIARVEADRRLLDLSGRMLFFNRMSARDPT
jgi:hypothetical protein